MRFLPYLVPAVLAASGAQAVTPSAVSSETLYLRARAAEAAGDPRTAAADLAALLARDPADKRIAQRVFRQAVIGGDFPLALGVGRRLDRAGALPPNGVLLLALDALNTRNWVTARAGADRMAGDRLFGFLAPFLRAWIAQASGEGDPIAIVEAAKATPVARAYVPEQRMLLLAAANRAGEGLASVDAQALGEIGGAARLRLADALAAQGNRPAALRLVEGSDPTLSAARAILAAGGQLPQPRSPAADGMALLLVRVAGDLARQQATPVALTLGRIATFVSPSTAAGWIVSADMLSDVKLYDAAMAALGRIDPKDPIAVSALGLRIAILNGGGQPARALAEAQAAAARNDTPLAWSRVGDLQFAQQRPKQAADAYGRAIAAAGRAQLPAQGLWPLLLQQGAALDQAGDWPGAEAVMERAYAIAPKEPAVLNQLGYSRIARREDVARSAAMIGEASALKPDDAAITDSLGWATFLQGKAEAAVPLLEKAAAGDPTEPTISEHLGDAYWTVGRQLEARYAWRAARVTAEDKDRARIDAKIADGLTQTTAAP